MLDKLYHIFVLGVCVSYVSEKLGGSDITKIANFVDWNKTFVEYEKGDFKIFGKTIIKIK